MKINDCSIVQDLLPLYIEDMLRPDTAAFVEDHLSGCETCTAALGDLKRETAAPIPTPDVAESRKWDQRVLKALKKAQLRNSIFLSLAFIIFVLHLSPWSPIDKFHQNAGHETMLEYFFLFTLPTIAPHFCFLFYKSPSRWPGKLAASVLCLPLIAVAAFPMFGGLRKLFYYHPFQTLETLLPIYWAFLACVLLFNLLTIFVILRGNITKKRQKG